MSILIGFANGIPKKMRWRKQRSTVASPNDPIWDDPLFLEEEELLFEMVGKEDSLMAKSMGRVLNLVAWPQEERVPLMHIIEE